MFRNNWLTQWNIYWQQSWVCCLPMPDICKPIMNPHRCTSMKAGPPLCIEMGFYAAISMETRCNCRNKVWRNFYHIRGFLNTRANSLSLYFLKVQFCKFCCPQIILNVWSAHYLQIRESVSTGAAGARTRRSLGHHLLHPLILRLLVLCAPAVLRPRALQDAPAPADPKS